MPCASANIINESETHIMADYNRQKAPFCIGSRLCLPFFFSFIRSNIRSFIHSCCLFFILLYILFYFVCLFARTVLVVFCVCTKKKKHILDAFTFLCVFHKIGLKMFLLLLLLLLLFLEWARRRRSYSHSTFSTSAIFSYNLLAEPFYVSIFLSRYAHSFVRSFIC